MGPRAATKILLIDDDPDFGKWIAATLPGVNVTFTTSPNEALELVATDDFDVVLTDVAMPEMNGLDLCQRLLGLRADTPVIVLTSHGQLDVVLEAMRVGAFDFLVKPTPATQLRVALDRAAQQKALREEVRRLRRERTEPPPIEGLMGDSSATRDLRATLDRIRDTDVSILVTGESGTGKEVVAQAIHRASRRSDGPFIGVNCAAMPDALLESELFGHVRGAFTDARAPRAGLFAQAQGGTLFLDEIGDMSMALQPKLLRVLQERRMRPVGGDREVAVDVRIIAATHRDLEEAIAQRNFREDLYFRIAVLPISLPPLRARGSDVLLLARAFVARIAERMKKPVNGLSHAAEEKLLAYHWPGNVRELQNALERAVELTRFEEIAVADLPEKIAAYRQSHVVVAADDPSELVTMAEVERRYVLRVLEALGGRRTETARALGFDRKTLYRKLREYGVERPTDGGGATDSTPPPPPRDTKRPSR